MSASGGLVAIIDYESGNLYSAEKAVARAIRESGSSQRVEVTAEPEKVAQAERIILPGVGAFADCRAGLAAVPGMEQTLGEAVHDKGRPFLGICVGMQLLADRGLEHGQTPGFGWVGGDVDLIPNGGNELKVPHMGWNTLDLINSHPLFDGIPLGEQGWHAYFVHSYHFIAATRDDLVAETRYGTPLTAAITHDNLFGTQFHPEKSQKLGLKLLSNFLSWTP